MYRLTIIIFAVIGVSHAWAQAPSVATPSLTELPVAAPTSAVPLASVGTLLKRDTAVELMATSEIRSDTVQPGSRFKLRLNKPVIVDGSIVVPIGATAYGEVVAAASSGSVGKSGKLQARLLYLAHGNAEIPLEGDTNARGAGSGSAVAASLLMMNPIGLFHRGNNAKIKAGEILVGFVREDVLLDLQASSPRRLAIEPQAAVQQPPVQQP